MTNSNLTVNIQNVFVLITVTMVFVSIPVLYWALSNLSIKKTILGMLIFLAAFGTGIWSSGIGPEPKSHTRMPAGRWKNSRCWNGITGNARSI